MAFALCTIIKTKFSKKNICLFLTLSILVYNLHFYSTMGYFPFSKEAFVEQKPFIDTCKCANLSTKVRSRSEQSWCSNEATARGMHQKVISFSLFLSPKNSHLPSNSEYFNGLMVNINEAKEFYPNWQIRIYTYSHRHFNKVLCDLTCTNSEVFVCDIENLPLVGSIANKVDSAMWRFLPLIDPTVDIFISRDLDATFNTRESAAVNHWIESDKIFHSMRDHPLHEEFILAGLWGAKTSKINNYIKSLFEYIIFTHGSNEGEFFNDGYDQKFLRKHIYPIIKRDLITHDSYFCEKFNEAVPFPVRRRNATDFVGNYIFTPYRYPISKECPLACRPSGGNNWNFC